MNKGEYQLVSTKSSRKESEVPLEESSLGGESFKDVVLEDGIIGQSTEQISAMPNKAHGFLASLHKHNSRVTALLRFTAAALYCSSGVQNAVWPRAAGAGITICSGVLGMIINQKTQTKEELEELGGKSCPSYSLFMLYRSFQPHKNIRQFAGLLTGVTSILYGVSGVMSGRYSELLFTANGLVVSAMMMFSMRNEDAWIRAGVLCNVTLTPMFVVNGIQTVREEDWTALAALAVSEALLLFSTSINCWAKRQNPTPEMMQKNCLFRYC